eukprot:SAG22_NODE_3449_length_1705_cov_7.938356_1_plen_183_part_00
MEPAGAEPGVFARARHPGWVRPVPAAGLAAAAAGADIITTVTPAAEALLRAGWVAKGTHISAMGADKQGKQELEAAMVLRDDVQVFAGCPRQAVSIGELQHAFATGGLAAASITAIGAVLDGSAQGRPAPGAGAEGEGAGEGGGVVTVFDSSGIALQDICVVSDVLAKARACALTEIPSVQL